MPADNAWEFEPSKFPKPSEQKIDSAFRDLIASVQHQSTDASGDAITIDLDLMINVIHDMGHTKPEAEYALCLALNDGYLRAVHYHKPIVSPFSGDTIAHVEKPVLVPTEKFLKLDLAAAKPAEQPPLDDSFQIGITGLTPRQQAAFKLIQSLESRAKAATIARKLGIKESTFRTHYLPKLVPHGLRNEGDGYYILSKIALYRAIASRDLARCSARHFY